MLVAIVCPLLGQDKDIDVFESKVEQQIEKRIIKEAQEAAANRPLTAGLIVIVEFIEVEMMDFSDWLLENPITTDATPLRKEVQKWVKGGSAEIIETLVVAARSGQRAKIEAISEVIYPTEYDPPGGAAAKEGEEKETIELLPPCPTAFETRNVGATLEVDPVVGQDGTIDLNLAPEIVQAGENSRFVTMLGDTEMIVEMPNFLTSKVTTQVSLRPGDYSFLGTSELGIPQLENADHPILLMFVRCDISGF